MQLRIFVSFLVLVSSYPLFSHAGENYPNLQSGYHDGFYIKTDDDKFQLKVGTRLNFAYSYGFVSPASDFSTFDLIHAKFYAGGNAFGPAVQYYFQAAAANNTRGAGFGPLPESNTGSLTLEDYYVRLSWSNMYWKLGQFKVPFGRQWMIYSGNFQFVDRALATQAFTFGRDRGITFGSERETFAFTLGVFNGGGNPAAGSGFRPANFGTTGQNVSNDTAGGARSHLYVARIVAMPFGTAGYSEGDVENTEGDRFDIGAGFVFDQKRDVDVNGDGVVDDTKANLMNASGDITWKLNGKSLQAEAFYRHLKGSTLGGTDSLSFYVQPGYFLVPSKWEIAGRFGWLDPDLDTSSDHLWEAAAVVNLYISGDHRYKAQLQYTWRAQETAAGSRNDNSFIDLMFQLTL